MNTLITTIAVIAGVIAGLMLAPSLFIGYMILMDLWHNK